MHTRIEASQGWNRWLLYPLLALTAAAPAAIASPPATPAIGTYRVVPISPTGGNAQINASGLVAFTDLAGGNPRAKIFDGNTVRDLGTLGGASAAIAGINDAGQVVGSASIGGSDIVGHVFRWSKATGMIDLNAPGVDNAFPSDINARGWVTGAALFPGTLGHAFRWTPASGMVDLGSLALFSAGLALNNAGTVVGWSENIAGGFGLVPVRWPLGKGLIPMSDVPNPFAQASDINDAGQIVGAVATEPTFEQFAFLWTKEAGFLNLGAPGPTLATADQINEKGVVIGTNFTSQSFGRGFVWTREHGILFFGAADLDNTNASDLNKHGQVVGAFNGSAFAWSRASGVVDLNTRLVGAPPELVLTQGVAISDNGSIVAAGNTGLVLLVPTRAYHQPPVAGPIRMTGTPRINALLSFSAGFRDIDVRDAHKAVWTWGDGSKSVGTVSAKDGHGSVSGQHAFRANGTYAVKLTVTDSSGKSSTVQRTVVVSASGAWIVGEGVFQSPAAANKVLPGRAALARFAFASERRAQGLATIRFNVAGLDFRANRYDSLTVNGGEAVYRGSGSVNGRAGYKFELSAAAASAAGGKDRFRIRISHVEPGKKAGTSAEVIDYDNAIGGDAAGAVVARQGAVTIGALD